MNTKITFLTSIILLLFSTSINAAQLLVSPNRIIFDKKTKYSTAIISNPSDEKGRYRVTLVNKTMNEDGMIVDSQEPAEGEFFADNIIRYSPKSFELDPNQAQIIRIKPRGIGKLDDGEYRTHMKIELLPESNLQARQTENVEIKVLVNYGITIPLIVRKGQISSNLEIQDIEIDGEDCTQQKFNATLVRNGLASSYGNIEVFHQTSQGESNKVVNIKGIAIYTSIRSRRFSFDIKNNDKCLESGSLKVIYTDSSTNEKVTKIIIL